MSGQTGSVAGNSALQVIEAITQFVGGTQTVWNSITVPVPLGLVVYATDTTVVKMGDGVTLYANLPSLFTISSITTLTAMVTSLTTGNATLLADYTSLESQYTALQTSVTALQQQVSTIAPTSYVSETGNVTVQSDQYFVGVANTTPEPTTVLLPATPVANEEHLIKDINGVAQSYNITIEGNGKLIDGQSTLVIRTNYGLAGLFWNGTSWSKT